VAPWGGILGNLSGRLIPGNPLPGLGRLVLTQEWPISLGPQGAFSYVAHALDPAGRPPQPGAYFPWAQVRNISVAGRCVYVGERLFVATCSRDLARRCARLLCELAQASPAARSGLVERSLRESLDSGAVSRRVARARATSGALGVVCGLHCGYLFTAAALVVWLPGFVYAWPWLLLGLAACQAAVFLLFARAHKELYPHARGERRKHLFMMALSPPAAARALDTLWRPLLAEFHPLAVAKVLLARDEFGEFAARFLSDLTYPIEPASGGGGPEACLTEAWFRSCHLARVEEHLGKAGLDPPALLAAPRAETYDGVSYCPRCRGEYAIPSGRCEPCGGRPLERLAAAV
jgi:hypothetical protein